MQYVCRILPVPLLLLLSVVAPAAADPAPEVVREPGKSGIASEAADSARRIIAGTVTETMTAEHSTFLEVATDSGKVWAVGPSTKVEVGDAVSLFGGFSMVDFHSRFLDRTFDQIYMVTFIEVAHREEAGSGVRALPGGSARSGERP